jgi:hypothetical protein
MVARPGQYQASLNAGELAPAVWGRSDIKQFYSGASLMQNAEPVPQGGFAALPGTVETGYARGTLADIPAPATFAGLGPHAVPATIYQAAFASTQLVACVDVQGLGADIPVLGLLRLETTQDYTSWLPFGEPFSATSTVRTRRIAVPPGLGIPALAVRLRLFGVPPSAATFSLAGFICRTEVTLIPPAVREFAFTYSIEDAFTVVLTPFHADIWKGDQFVGAAQTPVTAAMLPTLSREQSLNTMILWHPDMAPWRIMRRDNGFDWSGDAAPFVNLPLVDYGGTYANIVPDAWRITIQWSSGPEGLILEVNVNGEDAVGVQLGVGPNWTAFAANLKTTIEALPSVQPGIDVTFSAPGGASYATLDINFGGANAGQRFAVTPRITNVTTAAAIASHIVLGDPGGEEIMSSLRGWPATGLFYQDRLVPAGFRSEPGAVLPSVSGEYFDLNTRIENSAGAVLFRLGTSGAERVQHLARSKHLMIFTNEAEYFVSDRAIVRGTPPNVPQSSRNGSAEGIRPVENDGGILYAGRSRSVIYAATYSDVSQSYESEPISLLASHLTSDVTAMDLQRSSRSTDASRLWVVRDGGAMSVGVLIRGQDVTAFTRFVTDGLVRDVCVDGGNVTWLLVERLVGGTPRILRERVSDAAVMHQERSFAYATPQTLVSGLASMEGAAVWAIADGYAQGPLTVTGGAITLLHGALSVTVGRWTPPRVRTLPLPRTVGERVVLQRPVRAHTVRAHLLGTTSLAIAANGRPARDVPLLRGGEVSDRPIPPYDGPVAVEGLFGWSDEGFVEFTQTRPGAFRIRSITVEARI